MLSCYLKCRKNTESKNQKVAKTGNGNRTLLSNFVVCDSKKSRFLKQQEASGMFIKWGVKTPLSKIVTLGNIKI